MTAKNLLVELGTEELPPKALRKLATAFCNNFTNLLSKAGIHFESAQWYATPRRLAIKVLNLEEKQPDKNLEKNGPSCKEAFNIDGTPSKIGLAWAKSNGIDINQAQKINTPKGERLSFKTCIKGADTASLITGFTADALANLPIPRLMHWGSSRVEFVRPVHSLCIVFGSNLIDGEVLGLKSSRQIHGHRYMGDQLITIDNADQYPQILEEKGMVIADYEKRKQMIINAIKLEADKLGGQADMDPDLIEEVTSIVEYPVLLTAKFEEKFLAVPPEALVHTMKGDQKYFPVYKNGKLLPNFIFISNIKSTHPELVIVGNERVVRPRLADAEFFFNTDKKRTLFSRFEDIKHVMYNKQLGSLADKSIVVSELAGKIASLINANVENAKRAGILSKCDLVTNMVTEFTDTQGIMGMHYARIDGEPEDVALAINEQYMPRFSGDSLPTTPVSCAVSIAEKLTTLVGIFGVNMIPKGDKDPFGLRRASIGLLRIALENKIDINLKPLVEFAASLYGSKLTNKNVIKDVIDYVLAKFKSYYQDLGITTDIVQAVLASGVTNLLDFDKRVKAVQSFKLLPEAESLSAANKRVRKILSKVDVNTKFSESLLEQNEEKQFFHALKETSEKIQPALTNGNYSEALSMLAQLKTPIDNFFDKVMVNCDNIAVKNNRLAMLNQLAELFSNIADISLLQK